MHIKLSSRAATLGVALCALVAGIGTVNAQQEPRLEPFWTQIPPPATEDDNIPRTADGLPNIFDAWTANWRTIAPNGETPRVLEEGDRILPADFASEEKYLEWVNRDLNENPSNKCIPHHAARILSTPYKLEIVRTEAGSPDPKVIMLNEQFSTIRRFYTERHVEPNVEVRGMWGVSFASWQDKDSDGKMDTLVVDTEGLVGSWLEQTGLVYADGTKLHEEFWLSADGNILHMLMTVTDPVTYSKPIQHHVWWDRAMTDQERTHDEYECFVESADPRLLLERYNNLANQAAAQ